MTEASSSRWRWLLLLPAALLFLLLAASAGAWVWAGGKLQSEMDVRAAALRRAGWTVAWSDRTVSGFPYRLKLVLNGVTLTAPGPHPWGVSAPVLEAQAFVVAPTHWVFAAPQGLTIRRPMGGTLQVAGQDLRASTAGMTASPWRIAVAADHLSFATPADAKPFSFSATDHFEAHLRPAPDGSRDGEFLVTIDGGRAASDSVLHRLAADAPISLAAEGRIEKLSAATGVGWAEAVDAWSAAGGALRLHRLNGAGGVSHVESRGGLLGVGADGRLEGSLPLTLRQAPAGATAPPPDSPAAAADQAASAGAAAQLPVVFKGGRMRLGPFEVGPAPMIR